MLVTLGGRPQVDDLVDLLATCHRRIREHLRLARRLAEAPDDAPEADLRDAAAKVARYFEIGLPAHVADEEEEIAPRVRGRFGPEVDAVVAGMISQHTHHIWPIARLVVCCEVIAQNPRLLRDRRAELARLVEQLVVELADHLEAEERVLFPAIRALPAAERVAIREGMRRRRERLLS